MWKRFPQRTRVNENQISSPVLVETTYDESLLHRNPDISTLNSPVSNTRPELERGFTDEAKNELPPLPLYES